VVCGGTNLSPGFRSVWQALPATFSPTGLPVAATSFGAGLLLPKDGQFLVYFAQMFEFLLDHIHLGRDGCSGTSETS